MSSYYTAAQLEEMRRQRIMQELFGSIQKLKDQLMAKHDNKVQISSGNGVEISVFATDDIVEGYNGSNIVSRTNIRQAESADSVKREELDFSKLLVSYNKKPTKLEQELDSWITKVDERIVISEKDEKDRARVIIELSRIMSNNGIDIEDKIKQVRMRVSTYLQGAATVNDVEKERIDSNYYEYCAMCELLDVKPVEYIPYRVEKEIVRMKSILEKRKQDEYIMEVIEDIMDELGCHIKDEAVLDHVVGQMFSVDGHPLCEVFVGHDGNGIMFEPIGETKSGSLEKKRQIENSANHVCSMYKELEERAAERGVILNRVYMEPAIIDEMCVQDSLSERRENTRRRRTTAQRQRALDSEE